MLRPISFAFRFTVQSIITFHCNFNLTLFPRILFFGIVYYMFLIWVDMIWYVYGFDICSRMW